MKLALGIFSLFITSIFAASTPDFGQPILKDFGLGVQVESIQDPLDWHVVAFNSTVFPSSESHASYNACPFTCYNPCGNNVIPCRIRSHRPRRCPKAMIEAGDAQNGFTPITKSAESGLTPI